MNYIIKNSKNLIFLVYFRYAGFENVPFAKNIHFLIFILIDTGERYEKNLVVFNIIINRL